MTKIRASRLRASSLHHTRNSMPAITWRRPIISAPSAFRCCADDSSHAGDKKDAPTVIIINHAMARTLLAGRRCRREANHISKTIPRTKDWLTVVGVVGDVKDQPNSPGAEPAFWWSALQVAIPFPDMSLVVRADADPQLLVDGDAKSGRAARSGSGSCGCSIDGRDRHCVSRYTAICLCSGRIIRRDWPLCSRRSAPMA